MRTTLATVLTSLVVLLVMPVIGTVDAIGRWLPTRLSGALGDLVRSGRVGDYVAPTVVAVVAAAGLILLAGVGASRREL